MRSRLIVWLVVASSFGCAPREAVPAEEGADARFARAMAMHHEQAVEMALTIRDRSADSTLRRLALDIMLTQQAQIGQMRGWLETWHLSVAGSGPPMSGTHSPEHMGMATRPQMDSLTALPLGDAERLFLRLMIRHHQGGLAMAEEVLGATARPEVRRLATAIVASQRGEIAYMDDLRVRYERTR
jgi:uncharacterized protein (DUF305 family)